MRLQFMATQGTHVPITTQSPTPPTPQLTKALQSSARYGLNPRMVNHLNRIRKASQNDVVAANSLKVTVRRRRQSRQNLSRDSSLVGALMGEFGKDLARRLTHSGVCAVSRCSGAVCWITGRLGGRFEPGVISGFDAELRSVFAPSANRAEP